VPTHVLVGFYRGAIFRKERAALAQFGGAMSRF
jgi:hypothetical protein